MPSIVPSLRFDTEAVSLLIERTDQAVVDLDALRAAADGLRVDRSA